MSGSTIPSLNTVVIIGTVQQGPRILDVSGRRVVVAGVETRHEDGPRVHRVVIKDEFLGQAVHARLRQGALIHVTGELDMDDDGVHVAVVNRRGSDVQVLHDGAGGQQQAQRPRQEPGPRPGAQAQSPAPRATTSHQPSVAEPSGETVSQARATVPATSPGQSPQAGPSEVGPAETGARDTAAAPAAPEQPPRTGGLKASIGQLPTSSTDDEAGDPGEPDEETRPPHVSRPAPVQQPAPGPSPSTAAQRPVTTPRPGVGQALPAAGRPGSMPPRPGMPRAAASAAPTTPVAQPRQSMPSAGPRPGASHSTGGRPGEPKPLGPSMDDDDIPF